MSLCSGSFTLSTQADVDAFNCPHVGGSLTIEGALITNLRTRGLDCLESVGSTLTVMDVTGVADADGIFPSLTDVTWGIYFYRNHGIASMQNAFPSLTSTGDNIDFWYHNSLTSMAGSFDNLVTAGWSLEIGGNPVLVDIPAFHSLETISSSLYIMDNPNIVEIQGFNNLKHIDWSIGILDNLNLKCISGMDNYWNAVNYNDGYIDVLRNPLLLPEVDVNPGGDKPGGFNTLANYATKCAVAPNKVDPPLDACPSLIDQPCSDNSDCDPISGIICSNGKPGTKTCFFDQPEPCTDSGGSCKNNNQCCSGNCNKKICD